MPLTTAPHIPAEEFVHGTLIRDQYRWLEDRNLPETEEWIKEQQRRCNNYFAGCRDLSSIRNRVREYLDIEVADQPSKVGGRYFYRRRNQGQEQASIYTRNASTGNERLLVDASSLGAFASVGIHRISEDGSLLAYELKRGGGDRKAIHIVEVENGRVLADFIETGYVRGFSFATDNSGFCYCYEGREASGGHTIRFHRFGQSEPDRVCLRVEGTCASRLTLIADHTHLGAIHMYQADGAAAIDFWVAQRGEPENWQCIVANRKLPFSPILSQGRLFALSYKQTANGKLVELNHAGDDLRVVIPEQNAKIRQLVIRGDTIFVLCVNRTTPSLQRWSLRGEPFGCLDIPVDGTIQLLPLQSETADSIFYTYESFSTPLSIFEHNIDIRKTDLWHHRPIHAAFPDCLLRETRFPSKDGVSIPITITSPQHTKVAPRLPLIMTSYGGFGVSMTPQFSVLVTIMMELGVSFALPHIRGGGELGTAWHDAARGRNRQVAFDDFIAAAECSAIELLRSVTGRGRLTRCAKTVITNADGWVKGSGGAGWGSVSAPSALENCGPFAAL